MAGEPVPFNYRYFIEHAARLGGRSLDYGCGVGQMVALGRAGGLDIWGADTFDGYYSGWADTLKPEVRDRVVRIVEQRAEFPDQHFDLVMSNQVLEHVTDPERVVADIFRLLRPGGRFIAAFPVVDTWYEGHVGLYFAHRFKAKSRLRRTYFDLSHRLGFGLYRGNLTTAQWTVMSENTLDQACFYYPLARIRKAFGETFGASLEDISVDYMRRRLGNRASAAPRFADPLLRFVYHVRAGRIFSIRRPASI
jgi:SAM-dependent methyltransferase